MITYFDRLAALYSAGKLSAAQVEAAVGRGWITQEQADQIVGDAWE